MDALQQEVLNLNVELVKRTADAEGTYAMFLDMKAACPDSPTLRDSGKRYKDGSVKSAGRLVYEATFDRIVTESQDPRIEADPRRFRAD